jgi:hypothetical protein
MTGTNCDLFTHNQSRSYLNHLVFGTSVPSHYVVCLNNTITSANHTVLDNKSVTNKRIQKKVVA